MKRGGICRVSVDERCTLPWKAICLMSGGGLFTFDIAFRVQTSTMFRSRVLRREQGKRRKGGKIGAK